MQYSNHVGFACTDSYLRSLLHFRGDNIGPDKQFFEH